MKKVEKVNIITLGCSKNIVDSERIARQLKVNDISIVENSEEADSIIINTCGFIEAAKEESINTILAAIEEKKKGKINKVVVAGCLSERYMNDLRNEIPEVDSYFGTEKYEEIIQEFGGELKYELLGERTLSTPKHFAYLKISEGCDNPCSFCAIPLMRGGHKSTPIEALVKEAQSLAQKGVKELILIGQDTTDYGIDIYKEHKLADLMKALSEIDGIEWIRLLYAYPSHFPENVMDEIANNPKVLKYIDIPLQHISDNVLKSMRRGISSKRTKSLIKKLKEKIPNLTLRTTFIIGYPNETDEAFNELIDFIKETEFDRVGVFTYSQEDDTFSYDLGDPISNEIKEDRVATLMELQKDISEKKNALLIGTKIKVIIGDIEGENYIGRSVKDAPEVDGEVIIPAENKYLNVGQIYDVEIYDANEYDLYGKWVPGKTE